MAANSNDVFMTKLHGRFSECKLLIVIVTPELYNSKVSLHQIHAAASAYQAKPLPNQPIPASRKWFRPGRERRREAGNERTSQRAKRMERLP